MPGIEQNHAEITLDPYIVAGYLPRAMPIAPALGSSIASVTPGPIWDEISDQLAIDMHATTRWIADPLKLVPAGTGTHWEPSQGTDLSPHFSFTAKNHPIVAEDYSWRLPSGKVKAFPAFRLNKGCHGQLDGFTDHLAGYTVAFVIRIRRPEGGHRAPLFASRTAGDADTSADTKLVFATHPRRLQLYKENHYLQRRAVDDGRPFIVAVRQDTKKMSMVVGDANRWAHKHHHHAAVTQFDMNWFLGRGTPYSRRRTLVCDLVDIVMWDHALTDVHLHHRTRQLNHLYGAVRR